jgi:hypothetical protein
VCDLLAKWRGVQGWTPAEWQVLVDYVTTAYVQVIRHGRSVVDQAILVAIRQACREVWTLWLAVAPATQDHPVCGPSEGSAGPPEPPTLLSVPRHPTPALGALCHFLMQFTGLIGINSNVKRNHKK